MGVQRAERFMEEEKDAGTDTLKLRIKETYEKKLSLGKRPNQLLEECGKNLDGVRFESLKMVSLTRDFDFLSDIQSRAEVEQNCQLKSYQLLKSSKGMIHWLDRNASGLNLKQNAVMKSPSETGSSLLADKYATYLVAVIVLDSIKHRKLAEMLCRFDTTFKEIATNIHCVCRQIDQSPYSPFFLLDDQLICSLPAAVTNPDIQ